MAKATRTTSTDRMPLREARALLVEVYGSPRLAEGMLRDGLAAGGMPWGSLLQKGETSDDFWKSQPRVNFEENSASNKPYVRMFYVGGGIIDPPEPPLGCEHFGIWLSRPHVLALLPEDHPHKNEQVRGAGVWITAEVKRMKEVGKIPDGIGITEFSHDLAQRMKEAAATNRSIRAIKARSIENGLREWGLWPITRIK